MTWRALLIDDEPLARRQLRRLLAAHPEVAIVGEAGDGEAAVRAIASLAPDLIFLDVQMPGLTGFDVLARLARRPAVIFVTAHDKFALNAFDAHAIDYLLKPVEPARLARAIARLPTARDVTDPRLDRLLEAVARAQASARRIPVRRGTKVTLVDPAAAVFFRAEDKYTVLYTAGEEHVLDRTIDELERTLDPQTFVRIHRSTLVNITFVRDLTSLEGGRYLVTLTDPRKTQLHASRAGARLLRERLAL